MFHCPPPPHVNAPGPLQEEEPSPPSLLNGPIRNEESLLSRFFSPEDHKCRPFFALFLGPIVLADAHTRSFCS